MFDRSFVNWTMSLNLTCLKRPEHIRSFPNRTWNFPHPIFRTDEENLLTKFSSLITSSSFSSNDLQIFLKDLWNNRWKLPTKLLSSMIIYSSLSILLFLTCSILFYIISYSNFPRVKSSKYRLKTISILILIVFYFFILIKMILLIQSLNQTKISMEKSLIEINKEFNSKILSNHLKTILKNFDSFSSNSIIVDQTKLLIIQTLDQLFRTNYFLDDINFNLLNIQQDFNEILQSDSVKTSLRKFISSYEDILKDLMNLNKKICSFIDQNHLKIENEIYSLLYSIRNQFQHFTQLIDREFFQKINFELFGSNKEKEIRSTISIITNFLIIAITFITIIPISFFTFVLTSYFYHLHSQ